MKKWFAVYTKSRSEKKVAKRLLNEGVEVYCPLHKEIRIWSDRKKMVETPIFPSYVFVNIEEIDRLKVLEVPGVVNFVFWLGKPAIIRNVEMDAIKTFLSDYPTAKSAAISIKKGNKVEVVHGQLQNKKGIVKEIRNGKIVVQLEGIGFELLAEVPVGMINV